MHIHIQTHNLFIYSILHNGVTTFSNQPTMTDSTADQNPNFEEKIKLGVTKKKKILRSQKEKKNNSTTGMTFS